MRGPEPVRSLARFARLVRQNADGCWEWTSTARTWNGYGIYRGTTAHRWLYQTLYGPLPRELDVCHRCDVRLCVRPDHLFVGTRSDNMQDALAKGRLPSLPSKRTHCGRGHEYTPENIAVGSTGYRTCRACQTIRSRARADRARAERWERAGGNPKPPRQHGTRSMYLVGCRCEPCRVANSVYMRAYLAASPEQREKKNEARRRRRALKAAK